MHVRNFEKMNRSIPQLFFHWKVSLNFSTNIKGGNWHHSVSHSQPTAPHIFFLEISSHLPYLGGWQLQVGVTNNKINIHKYQLFKNRKLYWWTFCAQDNLFTFSKFLTCMCVCVYIVCIHVCNEYMHVCGVCTSACVHVCNVCIMYALLRYHLCAFQQLYLLQQVSCPTVGNMKYVIKEGSNRQVF